jgi:cytochrome c-type biogenesis protein CcmH
VVVAVVVPAGAVTLYLRLGAPQLPDEPFAERQIAVEQAEARTREMERLTAQLAQRLEENPDDPRGWVLLGRSYRSMNRFADAARAFEKAMKLTGGNPDVATDYGEALVFAHDGTVTETAREAFLGALARDPDHYKARFYVAFAKAQDGKLREALQDWVDLAAMAPAGARWLDQVEDRIRDVAQRLNLDPSTIKPSPGIKRAAPPEAAQQTAPTAPGPSQEEVEAAAGMSAADRQAMIQSMVDRLAARLKENPDDVEGWMRLGRSYMVMGRTDEGVEAMAKAADLAPKDKDVLTEYASAILTAEGGPDNVPPKMVEILERIGAIDPKNANALWYLGLAAKQKGHPEEAARLWQELLSQVDPGTAPYERLKREIDALPGGG